TVIVNSSDSTDHFEKYLDQGADFVIRGEAEIALSELVTAIEQKKNPETIEGLVFRKEGKTFQTPKRNVMKELDALPFAAWDLIEMERYRGIWMSNHGYFSLNMATTRGCPFKCNWCAKPIYGNRYNSRSPEKVVEELVMLKDNYQYDHIWFCDDIFGLAPGWVNRFADLVKEKNLKLQYKIQSRADLLLQENYIADLARSGCETAWMGAESGSQKILDAMDKGTTIDQIRQSTLMLKKYGIKPAFFLQFGYPGETVEDIEMTIQLLNELLPEDIGISVSYPLPGTKFYENVKSELTEKQNWTDSDELALMFKNNFPAEFYKTLHQYVHRNYRKHQGYESLKRILFSPAKMRKRDFRRAASVVYYIPAVLNGKNRLKKFEHGRN
ncbi:MAG TPA: radical SAM protein, partial [Bacteroidia bacterium]|nr:radical SAM protein [Bacteroidia bacterium]